MTDHHRPVVSADHRDHIERLVKSGVDQGAKLVLGGKRPAGKGYYVVPPLSPASPGYGYLPAGDIRAGGRHVKYADENKVIDMANDNTFGLCASVWTKNTGKAIRFANAITPAPSGSTTTR